MDFFQVTDNNFIRIVTINNPKKKNAISRPAYLALAEIINAAGKDEKVKAVVVTGAGDFFSSGNDLTQSFEMPNDGSSVHTPMIKLVQSFIRFPKLLIGIINGPAIGIAGTVIALCDILYMSEKAYVYTPFTNLALCAEGCSSLTFPKILGTSKANEMLQLNHKLTAQEAYNFGFVADVYKDVSEVWKKLEQIQELPVGSIIANKKLTRKFTIEELEKVNLAEAEGLGERFGSEEALQAMLNFASRRAKSKL